MYQFYPSQIFDIRFLFSGQSDDFTAVGRGTDKQEASKGTFDKVSYLAIFSIILIINHSIFQDFLTFGSFELMSVRSSMQTLEYVGIGW